MEYIWVHGPSGIGKRWLIRLIRKDRDIRERFEIKPSFGVCGKDIDREEDIETVDEILAVSGNPLLIKWQPIYDSLVLALKEARPEAVHRVWLVWRPFDRHYSDFKNRRRACGQTEPTEEDVQRERKQRVGDVRTLRDQGFAVQLVDTSDSDFPQLKEFPEELV